jgi:hypothetical protein
VCGIWAHACTVDHPGQFLDNLKGEKEKKKRMIDLYRRYHPGQVLVDNTCQLKRKKRNKDTDAKGAISCR